MIPAEPNHHAPMQSLRHLPIDIARSFVDMFPAVIGLLWDELSRWRLVRLPARSFDPFK